jgi:hypothetical protein
MRSVTLCLFLVSCLLCATAASGDTIGNVTAILDDNNPTPPVQPGELLNISDSALGISANIEVGQINWTLVSAVSSVGYTPGNTFSTYSVDIADAITPGQSYNFNVVDNDPSGTDDMESLGGLSGDPDAAAKLNQIEKLWAADYGLVTGPDVNAEAAALQVDIWQIIYGPGLVVSAVNGGSTDWETYANSWMSNLATETTTVNLFGLKRTSSAQDQAITDPPLSRAEVAKTPMPMPFAGGLILLGGFGLWTHRRRFQPSHFFGGRGDLRFQ